MSAIATVIAESLPDRRNPQMLVRVTTEDGACGTGECWWGRMPTGGDPEAVVRPIAAIIDDLLAPLCVGHDSRRIRRLWHRLYQANYQYGDEGPIRIAMSGIDLALWDLLGKRLDVSVAQLLGGTYHDGLPVYASLTWLGDEEMMRKEARRAADAGVRGIKLHERDPELVLAARDEIGPDLALMVDANGRLDISDAARIGRQLGEADLTWVEEPVWPMRDHRLLARFKRAAGLPVAAGENEFNLDAVTRLLDEADIDWLQPEVVKIGGISAATGILAVAGQRGIPVALHNYSLGPSFFANLQLGLSSRTCRWLELPWLPADQSFPSGIGVPPLVDGYITLPPAAGLGTPPLATNGS